MCAWEPSVCARWKVRVWETTVRARTWVCRCVGVSVGVGVFMYSYGPNS
jgi:hypothetical protein